MFDSKTRKLVTATGGMAIAIGIVLGIPGTALADYARVPNTSTYGDGFDEISGKWVRVPNTDKAGYGWAQ